MILEARNLTRELDGLTLFHGVSFRLEGGETLAVTGPSGSGKTSLLRCLAWLDPSAQDALTLDGRTPSEWGACAWRARVCYLPQTAPALTGTAQEFLEAVSKLSHQTGQPASTPAIDLGLEWGLGRELWQRPFSSLSGGEKQRLLLAIAVSRAPALLLLDEPTSAVDAAVVESIEARLKPLTKVWVTHDAAQARRVAQRNLVLTP